MASATTSPASYLGLLGKGIGRNTYQYRPLTGSKDLRLLSLAPGSFEDDISCALSVYSPATCPAYGALSYVWGDLAATHCILNGEEIICITANLHGALQHLRLPNQARVLWVDAICINQCDVKERNQQVQIMDSIYKNSCGVVVWLGQESTNAPEVFSFLHTLDKEPDSATMERSNTTKDLNIMSALLSQPLGDVWSLGESIWRLFERSWFSRTWVIQEIVLASHVRVICGKQSCSWASLNQLVKYVRENDLLALVGDDQAIRSIGIMSLWNNEVNGPGLQLPLIHLLSATRHFESTVPHDKVFALLGLAPKANQAMIVVDYRMPITELFTLTARHMMLERKEFFSRPVSCWVSPAEPQEGSALLGS